jgi:hypothetical protein
MSASYASMSLHAGEGARVACYTYPTTTPILDISQHGACLNISLAERDAVPSEHAVAFARELAREAERFAAEAERLYGPSAPATSADAAA